MKIKTTIILLVLAIVMANCGKSKKCYVCTSPTYKIAKQADYDNGFMPEEKTGCVDQEYMKGSDGVIHHKTLQECEEEISTWKGEGYECEWK